MVVMGIQTFDTNLPRRFNMTGDAGQKPAYSEDFSALDSTPNNAYYTT